MKLSYIVCEDKSIQRFAPNADLSSEAATPASIPHPRDLVFTFPGVTGDKAAGTGTSCSSDGQVTTPPSGYNAGRRRASMHDAIDLTKIDTRLYDKKLVRQASVTSIEEESQGTVHVSLEHNTETSLLTVNLRSSAQSRIHRNTVNPQFEEEFIFEVSAEEVCEATLEISFYEYDQFSKDECVGHVRIPLQGLDLSRQVDLWRAIAHYEKPKKQQDRGDIMFSLSYLPSAERLTVVVVKARNLRQQEDVRSDVNPFIKVCITTGNKKLKKKKTSTAHSTHSPTWNEALVFSVNRENLRTIGLEVSVYHDNKLGIDDLIGKVRLSANSEDGIRCSELLKEKGMAARWYNLS
ncbi:sytalpha [Elysia marginata]|uniref:Sytalpha n=1 Tax=Elysia marginata TaxID=1093978 RepID=A0AAV4JY25_9GAST|nr:sytalpha [Elysia marginata]